MSRPDDIRAHIREYLPEIGWVSDEAVRERIVDAFEMALGRSSWERLDDVPHIFSGERPQGDFLGHVCAVVQLCRESVRVMNAFGHTLDEQLVLTGALLHDVGKIVEYGLRDGMPVANRLLRHPMLGAHIVLTCGFPDEVAHIVMRHSAEGEIAKSPAEGGGVVNRRTDEGFLVASCDHLAAQLRIRGWRVTEGEDLPLDPGIPFNP